MAEKRVANSAVYSVEMKGVCKAASMAEKKAVKDMMLAAY